MRCPKCGYNSFDHLDSCKKCGKDLVEFKQNFGIKSVLFPGQMSSGGGVEDAELENMSADAAVAAVTGVAAATATAAAVNAAGDGSTAAGADGDDFGFDFMGDSSEDDDLSFDELFEEAPEDEDIEETIEAPKEAEVAGENAEFGDDFAFDLPADEADLEDDFGIGAEDDASASATEDDFSFDDEEPDSASESDDSGSEEDPKRPFDLPESPQFVGAPDDHLNTFAEQSSEFVAELSESSVLEVGESSSIPLDPDPVGESESVVAEREVIAVTTAAAAVATVAPSVVTGTLPEETVDTLASPPPLLKCIEAFICDMILLAVVGISFVVAAEAAMSTGETRLLPSLETLIDLSIPYFLVLFFLAFGYFTLFHFLAGQTPGKMLAGLQVETTEGDPLAFPQAFLRSVGGLLQLLPAGFGYLVMLTNPERRGWNDRLAGTRVVICPDRT
ncbi:MAG: RDD family protein [Thermodesulfobacteriota bacterium]|nr:RDD family protein [Thermodesulfobacteriota bacterium]